MIEELILNPTPAMLADRQKCCELFGITFVTLRTGALGAPVLTLIKYKDLIMASCSHRAHAITIGYALTLAFESEATE